MSVLKNGSLGVAPGLFSLLLILDSVYSEIV
jgi:hypothetical protein